MTQPSTHRSLALLLAATSIAFTAPAQKPTTAAVADKPLAFDVVTVKPHDQKHPPYGWNLNPTPDGYDGKNISLYKLIQEAYGDDRYMRDPKLITGGPSWINEDKFDLEAKYDPADIPSSKNLTYRQKADMLRAVLADRFDLKIHFEKRNFPVFNLVVAKNGLKMKPSKPVESAAQDTSACVSYGGKPGSPYSYVASNCMASDLALRLRYLIGDIVIDKTGVTGHYDVELEWTPDNVPVNSPNASGPSIFTALQEQLGLKLERSTAPLDVLVIDAADHPSAN